MIFASVGSMLPFDRLVAAVDRWAATHPDTHVFVQIGNGDYMPQHCGWVRMLSYEDYRTRLSECRLFIAHVGMGSILQGLAERRQMLLMPRLKSRGEHTTDHQLHTATRFAAHPAIRLADGPAALMRQIDAMLANPLDPGEVIAPFAQPALLDAVATFLARDNRA